MKLFTKIWNLPLKRHQFLNSFNVKQGNHEVCQFNTSHHSDGRVTALGDPHLPYVKGVALVFGVTVVIRGPNAIRIGDHSPPLITL